MRYFSFLANSVLGEEIATDNIKFFPGTLIIYLLAVISYLVTVKLFWGRFLTFSAIWALTAEAGVTLSVFAYATLYQRIRNKNIDPFAAIHAYFASFIFYLLLAPLSLLLNTVSGGSIIYMITILVFSIIRLIFFLKLFSRFANISLSKVTEFIISGVSLSLLFTLFTSLSFWLLLAIFIP